jgi:hypothetical protein
MSLVKSDLIEWRFVVAAEPAGDMEPALSSKCRTMRTRARPVRRRREPLSRRMRQVSHLLDTCTTPA